MKEGDLFSNKYGEYKVSKLLPNGRCIIEWINDGYVNGTAICKAAGKEIKHYLSNRSTKEYVETLSIEVGIPTSALFSTFAVRDSRE